MKFSTIATMLVAALTLTACNTTKRYFEIEPKSKAARAYELISMDLDQHLSYDRLTRFERSMGNIESGNNYHALGYMNGRYTIGKYQVLDLSVPRMTGTYLGIEMQPGDFLVNTTAQDLLFEAHTLAVYQQHPSLRDCASVWFSGRPMTNNNAVDITGTVVFDYVYAVLMHM